MKRESNRFSRFGSTLGLTNRDLRLIFACNLVGSFGDGLYAYLLPTYMTETLGASSVEVGILYAVMSLFAASTLFLAGTLADKYDRKKIMIAGWVAWLPAPLIFAGATNWLQMLPGRVMWGFWLGGPTNTAYIVAVADRRKLTLTFTSISAAWSLGYIFSPAVGGYLSGIVGMRNVFLLAFALYGVACIFLAFVKSQRATASLQQPAQKYSFFQLLRNRRLAKLSILFASIMFVLLLFRSFVPTFLVDVYHYGNAEIGLLGSITFASSAVLGILLGRLGDKRGKSYAIAASMLICSVALTMLLLTGNFYLSIFTFFMFGGSYLTWSLLSATVGPLAPDSHSARWISVPQTISMFSSIVAPYLGGVLYAASPALPFMVAAVATAILALIALTKVFEK